MSPSYILTRWEFVPCGDVAALDVGPCTAGTYSAEEVAEAEPVRFVGTLSVEKDRFSDLFQTMLYIRGFALVPPGKPGAEVWRIVSIDPPKGS